MLWPITVSRSQDGVLTIGDLPLPELAAQFGTPLYVYDERTLRQRARHARQAFRRHYPHSRVVFAGKAGMIPALVSIISSEGLGVDVVSGGELFTALSSGVPPADITFHGNYKSELELWEALQAGIGLIVIDNLEEIGLLDRLTRENNRDVAVLLRLNPGIDVHTHDKIATGVVDSKFGLPIWTGDAEIAAKRIAGLERVHLKGYHTHIGSQIFDLDAYRQTVALTVAFAAQMRDQTGTIPEIISPGGGVGIAYEITDEEALFDDWAAVTAAALRESCAAHGLPLPELVVEPGRSIIGPAGITLYAVGSIKTIPRVRTYVSVDGGMADNIRPSLYDAHYTAELANRAGAGQEIVTIAGRYCESGDVLIRDIALPLLQVGDLLAIPATGAYCLAMASNYNQVGRPAVVLVGEDGPRLIRRRETYQDLLATVS